MKQQDYKHHNRYVVGFHFIFGILLLAGTVAAGINLHYHAQNEEFYGAGLIFLVFILLWLLFIYTRQFPLKVQDRAIRAEEGLRYFILSGKAFDKRLTIHQIIALRFADDEEFLSLADKAAAENLSPDAIKKSIIKWKADHHRA